MNNQSSTPETDALMDVWRVGKLLSVSVMLDHARKLERERDEAREDVARLREALQRLADCDWVISLPDRMDAVRKIAREALEKMNAKNK